MCIYSIEYYFSELEGLPKSIILFYISLKEKNLCRKNGNIIQIFNQYVSNFYMFHNQDYICMLLAVLKLYGVNQNPGPAQPVLDWPGPGWAQMSPESSPGPGQAGSLDTSRCDSVYIYIYI